MLAFVFYFLALLFSLSINIAITEANKSLNSFNIDLIHRDSSLSPLYNSSMSSSELIENAAMRSISRFNNVHLFANAKESIETTIIPYVGQYLMKFYIGTPPIERLAIADTGSDLIWVQCSPCEKCFPQDTPLFEPNKSSTSMDVSCDSQPCSLLLKSQQYGCGDSGECEYIYQYSNGQIFTIGKLGIDVINFGSTDEGQEITFPKSIFGCGIYNNFSFGLGNKIEGIVGLGGGPLSLVSQLGDQIGHKFSYCLLPPTSNSPSKLKFGKEAMITINGVVSTPYITNPSFPTFYILNLEGIVVGQKEVQTDQSAGNIIIDSGSTLTMLEPNFYNKFVTLVKEAFGVEAEQNPPLPFDFCFRYETNMNMTFPNVVFQFTEARITLGSKNLLLELRNLLCLAIVPTTEGGPTIYGNVAQIDFQVEYDLKEKKVSFVPTDCTNN
ncbi:aspartic proteinase CDR1-like [Abrus precatorius]|uniref:Aspartic proteinase CDR1-like n=1 Tax=Abrus precatorius TaxID=3816 RepID=A0A8B8KI78_ABRPR|nr:aspartic proteinase CDR1-like [Abrus precatorius]